MTHGWIVSRLWSTRQVSASKIREIHTRLKLFAASHRGHIYFTYENVSRSKRKVAPLPYRAQHEDWLQDEITLAGIGEVEHEIVFSSGTQWNIRCRSISYEYRSSENTSSK
jgi:hypothetical protein